MSRGIVDQEKHLEGSEGDQELRKGCGCGFHQTTWRGKPNNCFIHSLFHSITALTLYTIPLILLQGKNLSIC